MSDASEFSLPYVELNGIKFGKISVTERAALLRKMKAALRAATVANLKDSGITGDQSFVELSNFDNAIWGAQKWVQYVSDSDGQEQILRTSLGKCNSPDQTETLINSLSLGEVEEMRLLCGICNLAFNEPTPKVPNMKQIGVMNGQPVYVPTTEVAAEGSDPNAATPAPLKGYGR